MRLLLFKFQIEEHNSILAHRHRYRMGGVPSYSLKRSANGIVGAAQYVRASPTDDSTCEFAITLAEDWRGCGLAKELLDGLLIRARCDHYGAMAGLVLAENVPMLALAHEHGFRVEPSSEGVTVVQVLRQLESGRDGQSPMTPFNAASNAS
jgi:L-amino acid N-acyltransferase YncA